MKKVIVLLLFSLFCVLTLAQEQQVRLILRSGGTVVGTLVGMDGVNSVTISIAGVESTISMADILSIEPCGESQAGTGTTAGQSGNAGKTFGELTASDLRDVLPSDHYGDYVILDDADYPESFEFTVAGQTFTMTLIRGGVFNMGYDGRHSLAYSSEPVHKVKVSSFYVSKELVNFETAYALLDLETAYALYDIVSTSDGEFYSRKWTVAKQVIDSIADKEGLPYRLITEAEWEYVSITPFSADVLRYGWIEWCNDYFGDFRDVPQIDPVGPSAENRHVARRFYPDNALNWDRTIIPSSNHNRSYVRLAISAKDVAAQSPGTLY